MAKISVGGQAVIEGVMMRAPNALAIAVRKPNGEVAVKEDVWPSLSNRVKILKWPLVRGSVVFLEALINGVQALSYSANQALEEEKGNKPDRLSSFALTAVILVGVAVGSWVTGAIGSFGELIHMCYQRPLPSVVQA